MSTRALRRGDISRSGSLSSPINVLSLPGTSANWVSTPDSVANSITSDIDIRAWIAPTDWTPSADPFGIKVVACKYGASGNRSWIFGISDGSSFTSGTIALYLSQTGSALIPVASTAVPGFTDGTAHWIRATWRNSDNRTQFLTSENGVAWNQLGADVTLSATGIFNSTRPIDIGEMAFSDAGRFAGSIYSFELRNGIDGTIVQSFDATAVTKLGTRNPSTVAAGGPWTVNGTSWDWIVV